MMLLGLLASAVAADTDVGGYVRVMGRPDLQGGAGRLGYWNLHGRLMNEGPYAMLTLRVDLQEPEKGTNNPWTSLYIRVEGDSISSADQYNGNLNRFRMSQVYVLAGNTLGPGVEWRIGTLEYFFGDLGLYDMRPAEIFTGSVGVWAKSTLGPVTFIVGGGDAGVSIRGSDYNPIPTAGALARVKVNDHLQIGGGFQGFNEPEVQGNTLAPYETPDLDYEDYVRGEVVSRYLEEFPGLEEAFPDPVPRQNTSDKAVGYLGFGGFGPLVWNSFFVSYSHLHPERVVTETVDGRDFDIYVAGLTDQRTALMMGNEMVFRIVRPVEIALAGIMGDYRDGDNDLAPSDHDRWFGSTVARIQVAPAETFHFLVEGSMARELSRNGNAYREHVDSVFASTGGISDSRGLEFGDTDTRDTVQIKGGVVLSPRGYGVWTRPSLRLLYGAQNSNVTNAFGSNFVDALDQSNDFGNVERHWHHLAAMEAEVWF